MSEKRTGKHRKETPLVKSSVREIFPNYFSTNEFNKMVEDFRRSMVSSFAPFYPLTAMPAPVWDFPKVTTPLVDMVDRGDNYLITADLPGFTKDDVKIKATSFNVSVMAEKKTDKQEKGKSFLRKERSYSTFERFLSFPEEVIPAEVKGTVKNGVLELKVPKKRPAQQNITEVKVE